MTVSSNLTAARQDVLELADQQLQNYRRQGLELRSHFNREVSALDGYRGRQLLELLQNADDAGVDTEGCNLLLHISRERLVVANTGRPFSKKGVTSLVISDCSPKQLEQNRFIGLKGLGFRSVLTWTDRPLILSGDYELVFDRQRAIQIVQELANELPELRETVTEFYESTGRWPAAIMRFPLLPNEDDACLKTAREYRALGYETVIILPLPMGARGDEIHQDIEEQLLSLNTSSLLFCRHLTEVTIAGSVAGSWQLDRTKGNGQVVLTHDGIPESWHVYRTTGQVSQEAADNSGGGHRDFETAVAVPAVTTPSPSGALCVFFPTKEHLPCPLVMHATLETTDDRNRLVSNASNREVLEQLALHVAGVLAQEATPTAPRRALELLAGIEQADPELGAFVEHLIGACAQRSLFPRLDTSMESAAHVRQVPHTIWLANVEQQEFPEVLPIAREDPLGPVLALFDLQWFDKKTLKARLQSYLTRVPPGLAGEVLGRLLAHGQLLTVGADGLLISNDSMLIDGDCFFPPTETLPPLPGWASAVHFVHDEFQNGLLRGAKAGGLRYLVADLNRHGAKADEYGFETVARALINQIEEGLPEDSPEIIKRWQELLLWICTASAGSRQKLPILSLKVITTRGALRRATACYLGPDYAGGHLLWRLYERFGQDEFVGSPASNGLGSLAINDAEAFLTSTGVNDAPRMLPLRHGDDYQLYRDAAIACLAFPLTLRGEEFASTQDFRRRASWGIEGSRLPDRFLEVLVEGDVAALAAYLLSTGAPLLTAEVDGQARLQTKVGSERAFRTEDAVSVPNPVLFFLRERSWVPTEDGPRRTAEIMLSAQGARVLKAVYSRHAIDYKDKLISACGGREALESLLTRLGAVSSLENLSGQSLYELLLALPEHDPPGEVAPRIYRTLMESSISVEESPYRDEFLRNGKMWGRYGGKDSYLPVDQLRYNANVTITKAIEVHIPLVDIQRGKSTTLVKDLFGIRALSSDEISVTLLSENTEYDPSSEDANQHLHIAIPYLYALRLSHNLDAGGRELNLLRKAVLRVCRRAHIAARLPDGTTQDIMLLDVGERIATDSALIMIGEYEPDGIGFLSFWLGAAELVAEFLGRDIAGEVGGILRCSTPAEMAVVVRERLGGDADAKLAEAKERLSEWMDIEEDSYKPIPWPKPDTEPNTHPSPATPDLGPTLPEPNHKPEQDTRTETTFQPIPGPSTKPTKRRKLVIVGKITGAGSKRGPIATEPVTLKVVDAFEQYNGRCIIPVNHLHGSEGFGCDLLSVGSQDIKEAALRDGQIKDSDILRYIEVNGRSSRTAEIELEDNEYRAAEQHREEYWIYRVYVDPNQDDHFEIALLSDPINSNAVRRITRFNMAEGSGATWYSMIEKTEEKPAPDETQVAAKQSGTAQSGTG